MAEAARLLLMYAVLPLWVLAGLADWACHRATAIERTSGLKENLLHWLLFGQVGLAMAAVAFLESNAAVMLLVLGVFVLHELTVYGELRYTVARRKVNPIEQMVHSFLELLPLLSLGLLALMRWDQVQALLGPGAPDLALVPKAQPWAASYLIAAAAAVIVLNVLPLAEETLRCLRARTLPRLAPR